MKVYEAVFLSKISPKQDFNRNRAYFFYPPEVGEPFRGLPYGVPFESLSVLYLPPEKFFDFQNHHRMIPSRRIKNFIGQNGKKPPVN